MCRSHESQILYDKRHCKQPLSIGLNYHTYAGDTHPGSLLVTSSQVTDSGKFQIYCFLQIIQQIDRTLVLLKSLSESSNELMFLRKDFTLSDVI